MQSDGPLRLAAAGPFPHFCQFLPPPSVREVVQGIPFVSRRHQRLQGRLDKIADGIEHNSILSPFATAC